ncbi:MAG: carbohydrate ABC transporter permease [Lachnospiraceae bacterium]|nr:carbohydrate ABC transporter permease [Lachnospiraceae bacterium]MDE7007172.1 carbohydrate ABC transporter permease [Lachnospiraceae bacterium]
MHKMNNMSKTDKRFEMTLAAALALTGILVAYPLIYVFSSSFSSASAVISGRVWLWPVDFSLDGYKAIFKTSRVLIGYRNSLFYMVAGTLINLFMTLLAAYPLSRSDMPGQGFLMMLFTFTMVFSGGMIPTYLIIRKLNILNTVWSMLLPGAINVYNMIITRTFMQGIPKEMFEAAQIDGCSDFQYFRRMILPLSKSVIAVIVLYYAIAHWNAYFDAFMYLTDEQLYPLQIFLRDILVSNKVDAGLVLVDDAANSKEGLADLLKYSLIVVATIPVMIVYPFVQKHFVKGVMIGAVKG